MADEYLKAALYGMKRFTEWVSNKVKDEISTEKLLDLFSDYVEETKLFWTITGIWYSKESGEITKFMVEFVDEYDDEEQTKYISIEKVFSKRFWFIQWLVENEKIDLYKIPEIWNSNPDYILWEVEVALMELAVQDKPIEFLVSILK